jgi:MerR family transcriptional regulator, thiopeptide resistance regulator
MEESTGWTKKYYSEEAQAKVEERNKLWAPELQEQVSREWNELFRDVEAAVGDDPARAKAQALGVRWKKLIEEFTGGDRQITSGLADMYQDRTNWSRIAQERMKPFSNPKVFEYIQKVFAARKTSF